MRQFHVEFRTADAAASPYLALGAVIFAGADGIRRSLPLPAPGVTPPSLPRSLPEALDRLAASETVASWFGPTHLEAYLRFKRVEWEKVAELAHPRTLRPLRRGLLSAMAAERLLDPDEPRPVTFENEAGISVFFLTCDHAGRAIPRRLGSLGLPEDRDSIAISPGTSASALSGGSLHGYWTRP